jgi:hypothetical protein
MHESQKLVKDLFSDDDLDKKPQPTMSDLVEQARQEWLSAQSYYNTVSDKDLVDHAVYMMQAAEKKYMYLLKKARQEGVTYSPYS